MAEKRELMSSLLEATLGIPPTARLTFRFGVKRTPMGVLQFQGAPSADCSSFISCDLFRSLRTGPSRFWKDVNRRFEVAYVARRRFDSANRPGRSQGISPTRCSSMTSSHVLAT